MVEEEGEEVLILKDNIIIIININITNININININRC